MCPRALFRTRQQHTIPQVRENIALGDPGRAHDDAAIEEAARLGGASELIARLPDGFDTYLERPVLDIYSGLPDGTTTLFGRKVDHGHLRSFVDTPTDHGLSGGQMQRLAVARTFMRSLSTERHVGLLLFDEPSASLDPTAEHGAIYPPQCASALAERTVPCRSLLATSGVTRE